MFKLEMESSEFGAKLAEYVSEHLCRPRSRTLRVFADSLSSLPPPFLHSFIILLTCPPCYPLRR